MKSLSLNHNGWIKEAHHIASPNFDARPEHSSIDMVVIHNISLPPSQYGGNGIIELFTNQLNPNAHPYYAEIYQRKVSSHFLIRRSGDLLQFVSCYDRAWHAGISQWRDRERCNDFSVGIELEGSDYETFEAAQYETLTILLNTIKKHFPIQHVVGHSDIAPGRKTDPGPYFDWDKINLVKNTL
jgi:N-acetyl-anhydromuramoyl-L-alanine amidase